jgi:hypothetical protein
MEWNNLAGDPAYAEMKSQLKKWLPKSDADDVYVLDWPREDSLFWDATLKAAERYHGKAIYQKSEL